jgi:transposase-like protein
MGETRRQYTAQEKVAILKQNLLEGKAISEVCAQHGLNPTVFYRWQKELFENGAMVFQRQNGSADKAMARENEYLRGKLKRKDEVLSELMEEHVRLKKSLGEI